MNNSKSFYIPTETKNNYIKITFYYDKGTQDFLTDERNARGVYVDVSPVEKIGYIETWQAFSGYRYFLYPAARYSKNLLLKAYNALNAITDASAVIRSLIKEVATKNNLKVNKNAETITIKNIPEELKK